MRRIIVFSMIVLSVVTSCGRRASSAELEVDPRVDSLLRLMTIDEKIGQMVLLTSDWDVTGPSIRQGYVDDIRSGRCGNIFNAYTVDYIRELQRIAVEESRLGIPLLFGYDVVHGHKTFGRELLLEYSLDTGYSQRGSCGGSCIGAELDIRPDGRHFCRPPLGPCV